jgi:hypothetical protein
LNLKERNKSYWRHEMEGRTNSERENQALEILTVPRGPKLDF